MQSTPELLSSHQVPNTRGRENDEIDIRVVLQALIRRRRLALAVMASSLLVGGAVTTWQRIHSPVFQGNFKLLVSDPINQSDSSNSDSGSPLEQLALSGRGTTTDTGALIQVLTSPLLLGPVESRLGLPPGTLETNLAVSTSRPQRALSAATDGVLEVRLQWSDPAQGKDVLEDLSKEYLSYSLRQRQEKLTQGLLFLDQQAPDLQQRVNTLQSKLADFRRIHGFVAPEQEAQAILQKRLVLTSQLDVLQQEQARLEGRYAAVSRGQLGTSSTSFPSAPMAVQASPDGNSPNNAPLPSPGSSNGSTPSSLQQLNDVETALAEAKANFTDSAPQVLELQAKRDRLRPLIQRQRQSELQADLGQNLAEQQQINAQLTRLSRNLTSNPLLIKQYDALQQQLDVAKENLSSYIKARRKLSTSNRAADCAMERSLASIICQLPL